jgi:hypothetical protein
VQDNRVFGTGGAPDSPASYGITGSADMIDNVVDGVFATSINASTNGISTFGAGSEVRGNRVRNLTTQGLGTANGIVAGAAGISVRGNTVSLSQVTSGSGIYGTGTATSCISNVVINLATPYFSCDAGYLNADL